MKNNLYYQDEYINETFNLKMFMRLLKGAGKNKKMFWGSVALEIFTSALSLVPSVLYSVIVATVFPTDGVLADNHLLIAGLCLGGLALVWVGLTIGYYFELLVPGTFAYRFCKEMREELFNHLTVLSFHYYDTHSTGKILVRVTNYVDEVSELFGNLFYSLLYSVGVVLVGMIWMIVLDWRIGGAVLLLFLPFIFVMAVLSKIIHHRAGRDHNKNANYTAFVAENINGAEVVRAYNRGKINGEAAETLFDEYRNAFMHTTRVREAFFPLAHGFTNSVMVLFVYGAALLIISLGWGALELGTVIAIASVLGEVTNNLSNLCSDMTSVFTLTTNIERIYDTIETPVDVQDEEGAAELTDCVGNVQFDNVNFSYVEDIPVLKRFTLDVPAGKTVAIVGATGSGKTTIVNLLSRFYDIQSGSVKIDGKDVRGYTMQSLRRSVGVMMQDTYLFSGTVLENIRFARPEATEEECIEAAKAACAHGFISRLPEGYNTEISESYNLSGGERQLLSFARLILADPKIVVLDEATSHIDTQTELEVQKSLKTLLAGRTSFVIAHRLSTIRGADMILFLQNGEIVERGTHSELLSLGGHYAAMMRATQG